jgi:hypothetical protein
MFKIISLLLVAVGVTAELYSQCACCAGAGAGAGSSNGDFNSSRLTLKKKQIVVEANVDYRTIKEGGNHNGHHDHHHENSEPSVVQGKEEETILHSMLLNSLGLRYGITDRITVSGLLPYVLLHTGQGNDHGMGDLLLLGTVNAFRRTNFDFAVQAGMELPTGVQKGSNFDNTTVVMGSGSLDPMLGFQFSKRWKRLAAQGNVLYKHTNAGFDKNYYGSLAVQNASLVYRLSSNSSFCSPDGAEQKEQIAFGWTVWGGYYGEWLDKVIEKGEVDENSGYYIGCITLGTNISYKKWNFPLTLFFPMFQQMNGAQNEAGFRVRLGLKKSFS